MGKILYEGSFKSVCDKLGLEDLAAMSTATIAEKIKQARDAGEQGISDLYEQALLRQLLHALLTMVTREYRRRAMEECRVTITREDIINPLQVDYIDGARHMGYMVKISIPDQTVKTKQIILPI